MTNNSSLQKNYRGTLYIEKHKWNYTKTTTTKNNLQRKNSSNHTHIQLLKKSSQKWLHWV